VLGLHRRRGDARARVPGGARAHARARAGVVLRNLDPAHPASGGPRASGRALGRLPRPVTDLKVAVLGLTFKENVPDLRNSKVLDVIQELREFGVQVLVHDPIAEPEEAAAEYGIHLQQWNELKNVDGLVIAVAHRVYVEMGLPDLLKPLRSQQEGVVVDVKCLLDHAKLPKTLKYWRL